MWTPFINVDNETVPAGGCVVILGCANSNGRTFLQIGKPSDNTPGVTMEEQSYAINDMVPVPAGGSGRLSFWGPAFARISGDADDSGLWTPENNLWELTGTNAGWKGVQYTALGTVDTDVVCVVPTIKFLGDRHYLTPAGGIPKATKNGPTYTWGSADCEEYIFNPSDGEAVPTGDTKTVWNSMPEAVGGGKFVNTQLEAGVPVVIVEPCADYDTGSGFTDGFDDGFS